MRLLVTGGAGFIGSNFVRNTLRNKSGVILTVLDSLTYAGKLANLEGCMEHIVFVEGDIRDQSRVEALTKASDHVVNFAAESHNDNSLANPAVFFETNLMGVLNLVQACVKFDVPFHQVSTDEVYGDLPLDSSESFTNSSKYKPSSPYSASKAAADHVVRAWGRSFGLRATISNCSNNYGAYQDWEKFIPHSIRSLATGQKLKLYGSGLNVRDWIHVEDHCDGIWAIIERGSVGATYLLGANDTRTNLEIAAELVRIFGRDQDAIEMVQDRPGHDLRYSIDTTDTTTSLGWQAKSTSVLNALQELVPWYLLRLKREEP